MKALRRLYGYLRRYKIWAVIAFGSMIVFAVTQTAMIALTQPLFDDVLVRPGTHAVAPQNSNPERQQIIDTLLKRNLPEGQRGPLINAIDSAARRFNAWWNGHPADKWKKILFALVFIFIIRAFASYFAQYGFQVAGLSTVRDLRNALYERIIHQSHRFFTEHSTGEMVSRVVSDADAIQAAVSQRMGDLFQQSITLFALLLLVLITNTELALITLLVAPALVFMVVHFGLRLRRTTHRSQERMADLATVLEETVRGVRIVKAFTMEKFEINRFREATRRHLGSSLKAQRIQSMTSPVMEVIAGLGVIGLLLYAHRRIAGGALTTGQFVSFVVAIAAMYEPIKKLNRVNLALNTALSASERVFRMLDVDNEVKEKPGALVLTSVGSGIRYENVTFAYNNGPVLSDVGLAIAPGEIVALVGSSGAGKTTFVNLLPRFYDVQKGRITIDGHDVRDVTLDSLRGLMGFVTQEVVLFNDTVRNNIAYGRADADESQVIEAARAANAHEFITAMPQGYDTPVGESGFLLSGGQRQRLAIARALFKNPPILVLDEATSSLDTESERLVQQALNNLMLGRTTLVIAHRLSTVRTANKIVVLEHGQIVEIGGHEDLLVRRGVYRRLHDLQFVDQPSTAGALA